VVEKPSDVHTLERAGVHRGKYHVLHGVLSPLDGIGPDDLKIKELLARLDGVREVVLATNPSVEGEATALYLSRLIKPFQVKVTQLAYGLPVGGMIEYSDRQTIYRAMENRVEIA
jgi:recombination protein RecR